MDAFYRGACLNDPESVSLCQSVLCYGFKGSSISYVPAASLVLEPSLRLLECFDAVGKKGGVEYMML